MKKQILASLSVVVLLFLFCFSNFFAFASTLSASDKWSMGSGWVDYSTADSIVFENSSDTAAPNFNNTLIDGTQGYTLSFKTTFLDPSVQTTAGVTLRLNSNTMKYFSIRVTGKGTAAMLQVDYCDNGSWISMIPYTGEMEGANGSVITTIEREAGKNDIVFSLKASDGTLLYSKKVSSTAIEGDAFLNCDDLEFIVLTYKGYGLFRFSDYSAAAYPDDGIEDPLDASTEWTMGTGWVDSSTSDSIVFSNTSDMAVPNFRSEKIDGSNGFKLSFTTTVKASAQTTADITLRLTSNNNVYMRILATGNNGSANVDVNFFNGQSWTALSTSGWREGVGASFVTTIERQSGSDAILFTLSKTDGTVLYADTINNPVITGANFFYISDIEALVVPIAGYGLFAISDFNVVQTMDAASEWTMGTGWENSSTMSSIAFSNTSDSAVPNFRSEKIDATKGFKLSFTTTVKASAQTTADITLRLTSNNNVYMRILATGNNGNGNANVDVNFYNGQSWTALSTSGWREGVGTSFVTRIERQAGSDNIQFTLLKTDGTVLFTDTINNPVITGTNFFNISDIEALAVPIAGYGLFKISDFAVEEYPKTQITQSEWILGDGWEAYADDNGKILLVKADSQQTEAVYTADIAGSKGFKITYDITYDSLNTTATYFKLRIPFGDEKYLFVRVKGDHNQTLIEGQMYNAGSWSSSILSANSGIWVSGANGKVTVCLERQEDSDTVHLQIKAASDGTVLCDEIINNSQMTSDNFLDSDKLQFIIGRDSAKPTFQISNFSVSQYPLDPVDISSAAISGSGETVTGTVNAYAAVLTPGNATIASYRWMVNGEEAGTDASLSYIFQNAGHYTLSLSLTDKNGHTKRTELQVSVSQAAIIPKEGDVNADGFVNSEDAMAILRYAVGSAPLTTEQKARADINTDGIINSADAYLVLNMA